MYFSTADLCDEQGEKLQILNKQLQHYGGVNNFFGEVVTLQLDEDNRGLVELLRNEAGAGRVVVVDAYGKFCAVVGDNLMGFAKKNGWAGIVINGYVRDIRVTRTIDVGLLALGTCPQRSLKRAPFRRGEPLEFGNVVIQEGSWLYADEDGVILSEKELTIVDL